MNSKKPRNIYIVWKGYQRRAEVLAPLVNAQPIFIPHIFSSKYMRLLDYLIKLILVIVHIGKYKPKLIITQAPPLYSSIPALVTGTSYIIDAHNPVFQSFWGKLPLSQYILNKAKATVVHNNEILHIAKAMFHSNKFYKISDPIEFIPPATSRRLNKQIIAICSFDKWDEPIELLIDCIRQLPEYTFVITADINKLLESQKNKLQVCSNVNLTGFLSISDYHTILTSSLAALVLTTSEATQPSGACEALSSDTQLIISKTTLTKELFGEWAILVENTEESIIEAFNSLQPTPLDLSYHRSQWNKSVKEDIRIMLKDVG